MLLTPTLDLFPYPMLHHLHRLAACCVFNSMKTEPRAPRAPSNKRAGHKRRHLVWTSSGGPWKPAPICCRPVGRRPGRRYCRSGHRADNNPPMLHWPFDDAASRREQHKLALPS